MKRFAKIPVEFETVLTAEELEQKIDEAIKEQQEENLFSQKGRQLFLWERGEKDIALKFFHSFKNDMCDTAFYGKIEKGLKGCRLEGFIKKPPCVWAVFWVIAGITLAVFAAFLIASTFADDPQLGFLPVFALILLVVAFVEVNLLMFDKKRLKAINEYLRKFTSANNIDVLGEDLEAEEEKRAELIREAGDSADSENDDPDKQ